MRSTLQTTEDEFGHARIHGAHVDRDGQPRPARTPPDWAMQQAVKTGFQPRKVADVVKQLWGESDSSKSDRSQLPTVDQARDALEEDEARSEKEKTKQKGAQAPARSEILILASLLQKQNTAADQRRVNKCRCLA